MHNNDQEYLVQKIRTQYTEREHTELDALKQLDKQAKAPANRFAFVFGILGALILGSGMSLIMTDISSVLGLSQPMVPGIVVGVIGMLMVSINYPIYKKLLASRRKKYADRIIALSNSIMEG